MIKRYSITANASNTITEVSEISIIQFPNTIVYGLTRKVRLWYSKRPKKHIRPVHLPRSHHRVVDQNGIHSKS
jgi:hypothetical protein